MIKIIAHRGNGKHKYKENTKEALNYSLKQNYIDGVELDIRMTKDKKIVIIHDPIIDMVSDGIGLVNKMTLKKLKKYNFGSKDNPSKICTLNSFLKHLKTNKKIVIEIKWEYGDFKEYVYLINKIVSKYKKLNIYLISFNYKLLKYLKTNYPCNKVGILIGKIINKKYINNIFDINLYSSILLNEIKFDKEIMIWNIRNKNKLKKIPNSEFDINIITNESYLFTH